jgi:hypothetical protein
MWSQGMGKVLKSNNEMKAGPGIGSAFFGVRRGWLSVSKFVKKIDKQHKVDNKS